MNKSLLVIGVLGAAGILIFILSNQKETDTAPAPTHAPDPAPAPAGAPVPAPAPAPAPVPAPAPAPQAHECSSDDWTCSSQIKYSMCIGDLMDDSEPSVKQYIFDYLSDNNLIVSSNIPNTLEYGFSESNIILTPGNEVTNNCTKNQVFRFICQNPCRILEY